MALAGLAINAAARIRSDLTRREADPLSYWHFAVPRVREALRLFSTEEPIDELHLRGPNLSGKTESSVGFMLGCLQRREELDGVVLPKWRGRVEGAHLVLDFKQQLLSVQPAYLRLLGKWPHHARYVGEVLSSLYVKPIGGTDDETEWSVVHFLSQENKRSGVGVRADVVAFDEPPVIEILRELRKAAHAGRRCVTLISETPTIRRQWGPLQQDYGDTPRRTIRRVDRERAEVRWSLDEVADWVLSREEKARLLRKYATDPLHKADRSAREHGDYMATEGSHPWGELGERALIQMLEECTEPLEVVDWRITEEGVGDEVPKIARTVPVEVWKHAERGKSYYVCIDPSSGVDDSQHDPYELEIAEVGSGDLVARAGGYLSGRTVGILAAGLARQYSEALIDPEVNDRWGVNVVEGVYAARYANFARERRELRPGSGQWSNEIGFHNNGQTRPLIIGAIQAQTEAWAAGIRYGKCPSRFVIETLLDCIVDEAGKIVGAPGVHDEALIVRGQTLRKVVTRSGRLIPEYRKPPPSEGERLAAIIRGENEAGRDWHPSGQSIMRPKVRPR